MKGSLAGSAVLSVIGCGFFASAAAMAQTAPPAAESKFDTFGWGVEFKLNFPGYHGEPVAEVSGLPDAVRTVPIHNDDAGAGTPIVFSDQKLRIFNGDASAAGFTLVDLELMPVLKIWRFKPKFGVVATIRSDGEAPKAPGTLALSNDFPEITYQGNLRDEGSALVYMAARSTGGVSWATVKELEIEITKSNSFLVGSKNRHYDINVESGWDRYDSLEVYKTYTLGRTNIQQVYLGWLYLLGAEPNAGGDVGFHFLGGRGISTFTPGAVTATLGPISNPWFFQVGLTIRGQSW